MKTILGLGNTMNDFNSRVYRIVEQIPRGKVATYGQIAALAGNPMAARAVGTAMRNTPAYLNVPCHRVVNQAGTLAPGSAFGGQGRQREILEAEGVSFCENGLIDMKKCIWKPAYQGDGSSGLYYKDK
jgi:methylated-DNA-protein-cysteine methyltransferase-like protein